MSVAGTGVDLDAAFAPFVERAEAADAADPLAGLAARFVAAPGVVSYLDGNSLGRPPAAVGADLAALVEGAWGTRLIRSWDEQWMSWPEETGDLVAAAALGAAPGQTVVADSTTVMLYKLARACVDHARAQDPARTEILLSDDDFPTDRYVAEGIAAERGMTLRWIPTDPDAGPDPDVVGAAFADSAGRAALVLLSHVSYRSGRVLDGAAVTAAAHAHGALVLWDLSHSVGSVPLALDDWGADAAVGCTYKYLCGGPGAPAFGYLAARHHGVLHQPVQGWMGREDPFTMGPGYRPAPGIRSLVSGTPPVLGLVGVRAGAALVAEAGIEALRAKSLALTDLLLDVVDEVLEPAGLGVTVASPRAHAARGGHLTLRRPDMRGVTAALWERGVIPDFRAPDGLRLGPAPLSSTFLEVVRGARLLAEELRARA